MSLIKDALRKTESVRASRSGELTSRHRPIDAGEAKEGSLPAKSGTHWAAYLVGAATVLLVVFGSLGAFVLIQRSATPNVVEASVEAAPAAESLNPEPEVPIEKRYDAERAAAIESWLHSLEVTGVRLAGEDSRVLIDGTTFRRNARINHELGLIVYDIQREHLLFRDDDGYQYIKYY